MNPKLTETIEKHMGNEKAVLEFNRTKIVINIWAPRIVRVWAGKFLRGRTIEHDSKSSTSS